MKTKRFAAAFALLAAALYAINIPLSKLLLAQVQPTMMAAFLYLGAGMGLFLWGLLGTNRKKGDRLTKNELPYTLGMIVLDIAAPILLMLGLRLCNSASASLLNNFEIVATSVIAFFVFKEALSKKLTFAIVLVTLASIVLGLKGKNSFQFNIGSLFVLGAASCWGLENNCTRMLSSKSSVQITTIKGIFSGLGSLIVALVIGEKLPDILWILPILLLGFVSYGLSINFLYPGAKRTGRGKDKCLLFDCSFSWRNVWHTVFGRTAHRTVLYRSFRYARSYSAGCKRYHFRPEQALVFSYLSSRRIRFGGHQIY